MLLKAMQLQRSGIDIAGMGAAKVAERFEQWRRSRDAERIVFERKVNEAARVRAEQGEKLSKGLRKKAIEEARRNGIEYRRAQVARLFKESNAPDLHVEHLASLDGNKAWWAAHDEMLSKMQGDDGFLYALLGNRGTGKTQMAVSLIRRACDGMETCLYLKAAQLFAMLRASFAVKGAKTEDALLRELTGYHLLVVDEVHQRGGTDYEQNTLVHLIDRRYDAMACTLLIANQDRETFAREMGDSVTSRIHEKGRAIECRWGSYRKPEAPR